MSIDKANEVNVI